MTGERSATSTAADNGAAALFRAVGLMADGPVVWGRPVPARGSGVFVIELPAPLHHAPLELTRIGKWLEHVPGLRLDGEHPTSRALAARLESFWLPVDAGSCSSARPTARSAAGSRRSGTPRSATAGRTRAATGCTP